MSKLSQVVYIDNTPNANNIEYVYQQKALQELGYEYAIRNIEKTEVYQYHDYLAGVSVESPKKLKETDSFKLQGKIITFTL